MDVVKKPFNSVNRRYREGDEISERDDIAPHDYADFKARGFIGGAAGSPPDLPDSSDRAPRDEH